MWCYVCFTIIRKKRRRRDEEGKRQIRRSLVPMVRTVAFYRYLYTAWIGRRSPGKGLHQGERTKSFIHSWKSRAGGRAGGLPELGPACCPPACVWEGTTATSRSSSDRTIGTDRTCATGKVLPGSPGGGQAGEGGTSPPDLQRAGPRWGDNTLGKVPGSTRWSGPLCTLNTPVSQAYLCTLELFIYRPF